MRKLLPCLAAVLALALTAGPAAFAAPLDPPAGPVPSPAEPGVNRPALPDPNDPNSPDTVTILEDDVPLTYIRIWDPEKEEYVYLPDDEVPLARAEPEVSSPQTGEAPVYPAYAAAAGAAVLALGIRRRGWKPGTSLPHRR